jgi:hypothetical protein
MALPPYLTTTTLPEARTGCTGRASTGRRHEVRREQHLGAGGLLDLRGVPVVEQPVRGEVLVDGAEVRGVLEAPSRPAHAGGGVDDHTRPVDGTSPHERGEGERPCRDVAPGCGDEPGTVEIRAEELGQAVRETGEQLRAGGAPRVPLRVERGVLQPEVGCRSTMGPHASRRAGTSSWLLPCGRHEEHEVRPSTALGRGRRTRGRDRPAPGSGRPCGEGARPGVTGGDHDFEPGCWAHRRRSSAPV